MSVFPSASHSLPTQRRVSLLGVTEYGRAFALSLVARNCATHLTLVDKHYEKAKGEALDLQDALPFLPDIRLSHSSDARATADSDVVVITVGRPFGASHASRRELIAHNSARVARAAFAAAAASPDAVLLVGSDPVDVMTYVAAKAAFLARPQFEHGYRVLGAGAALDVSRLRAAIARRADVDAGDVAANVVGEHGEHIVPLWRYCRIRGMAVERVCAELADGEVRQALTEEVRNVAQRIVQGKPEGSSKGIGQCLADLTQSLLTGIGNMRTVSTRVTSRHIAGLTEDVYMSVPCKIDSGGVAGMFPFEVDADEREKLMEAARVLCEAQREADAVLAEFDSYHGVVSVSLPRAALRSMRSLPVSN